MDAAESRTEGTLCSSCSVPFDLGIRCGLGGWEDGGDGGSIGSMSRSKMADEDEWLEKDDAISGKRRERVWHGRTLMWVMKVWRRVNENRVL